MKLLITKAAALVLLWTLCLSTALWSVSELVHPLNKGLIQSEHISYLTMALTSVLVLFALPLSGWLADSQFGNFKVFRAGCVLMFMGSVLLCLCFLVKENFNLSHYQALLICSILTMVLSQLASFAGGMACLVTVFQLGLDQMPDASSAGITSYILLFWTVTGIGIWMSNSLFMVVTSCIEYTLSVQGLSLIPVICMCSTLVSIFLFGRKWLIVEPKSPRSLRIIYRVLRFAVKHKAPLNRSALTYWEEHIPSRLDLGKLRYGGPFTIEQVEDVKTFFRLLLVLLPVWIAAFSASVFGTVRLRAFSFLAFDNESTSDCLSGMHEVITDSPWWCGLVAVFVYKACICCLKNRPLSMLKRLGFYMFLLTLCNIVYAFVGYFFNFSEWPKFIHTWLYGFLLGRIIISSTEFVCAQSPYSMRGLLSGLYFFIIGLSVNLGVEVFQWYTELSYLSSKYCLIILYSFGGGLSIVGFLLYLVVAGQYKRRVRDEEYHPHACIEDIYDRYLTQANIQESVYSDQD